LKRIESRKTKTPKMKLSFIAGRGCLILFFCPFLVCGLWATKYGYGFVHDALASNHWPGVRGRIESADVAVSRASGRNSGGRASHSYGASIGYSYEVNGKTYTCDNVFFGDYRADRPGHAERQKAQYPVGREVNVYYNPDAPEIAVLEPGPKPSTFVVMGFGLVFSVVALVCMGVCLFAKGPAPDSVAGDDTRPRLPP